MERFFDHVWRTLIGAALFVFALPVLAFLAGELTGDSLALYGGALIRGLTRGCIYSLVALGLTVIYRSQKVVNFAQGEIVALGFFVMVLISTMLGLGYWVSAGLTIVFMVVISLASGLILNTVKQNKYIYALMATLGLGLVISVLTDELTQGISGAFILTTPFSVRNMSIGGVVLSSQSLAVLLITVSLSGGLFLFVRHSRWGASVRAVWLQGAIGFSKTLRNQLSLIAWGLAGGFGAVAGILIIPAGGLGEEAHLVVFKALAAIVLGGFGSLRGALIGGLLIGASEAFAGLYISYSAERITTYVILFVVLLIRPSGLLGERQDVRRMDGAALS